jgi:thioredoxin-related protein
MVENMNMNHIFLITSVILISTLFGVYLKINRGKLIRTYQQKSEFAQILPNEKLADEITLILFSTEYCSICPRVKTQINEILQGQIGIKLIEVDAVKNIEVAKKLHVKSSPTVIIFDRAGNEEGRIIGAPKKNEIINTIQKVKQNNKENQNAN